MDHAGPKVIQVIKEIRAVTGLGLVEAKRLADHTPSTVLSGVDRDTATAVHGRLAQAGAVVRVAEA
ncbi:ribosomal protein L7/L12 [Glycomyces sp. A-F 0318]|nr:ribosomal protein L7/L12 [Glycomyces amatae]